MRLYLSIFSHLYVYFNVQGGLDFDVRIPLLTFLAMLGLNMYRDSACGSAPAAVTGGGGCQGGPCRSLCWDLLHPEIQTSVAG